MSFDGLIRKIETLEKRLSSALPSDFDSAPGCLSDPAIPWDAKKEPKPPQHETQTNSNDLDWDHFLEYLGSENRAMSKVLRGWQFLNMDGDTIEIAKAGNAFSADFLEDPERLEKLKGHCKAFFKREMEIRVLKGAGDNAHHAMNNDRKGAPKKNNAHDLSPPVQDILDVFQAEVKGVVSKKEQGSMNHEKSETSRR
jgi:hypothetical protein